MSWVILVRKVLIMVSWREPILTAQLAPNRAYAQHHEINGVQLEGKKSGGRRDDFKLPRQRLSAIDSLDPPADAADADTSHPGIDP